MIDCHEKDRGSFVIGTQTVPLEAVHRYGIISPGDEVADGSGGDKGFG